MRADVCIVGSGPAGAILGAALVRQGVRVTVLESGPRHPFSQRATDRRNFLRGVDPWLRTPEAIDVFTSAGKLDYPLNQLRVRAVGGTSLHWAAETPRLHANDFRMRSRYGVAEDWPLDYGELEPYYVRAERELGVAGGENPFASPRSEPYALPPLPYNYMDQMLVRAGERLGLRFNPIPQARNSVPYGGRSQCLSCATCYVCPSGAKASVDLTHVPQIEASRSGSVIVDATVLRLETGPEGRVRRAVYAGIDRVEHSLEATLFVLAGGGIETPRLLLLSAPPDQPAGLANRSGLVGHGLREHPICFTVGHTAEPSYSHRISFYTATCNQFSDGPQRAERASFSVFFNPLSGPSPADVARTSGLVGDALARKVKSEFGHSIVVESPIDMLSDDANRVDLDPELRDYFGLPAPRISLSLGRYEQAGIRAATALQARILEAHGATDITSDLPPAFIGHPAGACRMGSDPDRSVADASLRCHDVANLYLVSSAVFVTSGLANPTLTIAALALRLADHLLAHQHSGGLF